MVETAIRDCGQHGAIFLTQGLESVLMPMPWLSQSDVGKRVVWLTYVAHAAHIRTETFADLTDGLGWTACECESCKAARAPNGSMGNAKPYEFGMARPEHFKQIRNADMRAHWARTHAMNRILHEAGLCKLYPQCPEESTWVLGEDPVWTRASFLAWALHFLCCHDVPVAQLALPGLGVVKA